ncbi:MAG: flagellar hook-length control protein FliK [Oscillospiraceae bacterium]|nr:flagellar hook-length control protein FliK [Oscillospiraceae bacterium]
MDNTVMLGLQAAVAAAAVDVSGGVSAIPEGGESFSAVLASTTAQTGSGQGVQDNSAVQDSQAAGESSAAEDTAKVGNLSLEKEDEDSSDSALGVILDILESTEDDGTLKGMKILAKAVLNAMMGENGSRKKKTDLFAFMGEGYDVFADDYNLFLTGTEMLSQIGIALKADLMAAEEKAESGLLSVIGSEEEEDFMSSIDEIISKLDKIIKKLYSADDDTDENTAAEALAAMLGIPADTDLDYVLTPVKEQAIESAAEVLTSAKEIVAEESPEDVPKMEQLYSELTASVKSDKSEMEQSYGVHEAFNVNFTAVKINNAADQLKAINGEEAAAAAVDAAAIRFGESVTAADTITEVHTDPVDVEEQITEAISERLFDMKEDNGTEELIMVLKPENLGQVAIKLVKENGAVSVLLSAQYDEVGKLMAERAANLGSSLQSKDVQVKDINVVDPGNAAEQMGLNFTNQGFSFARNFGGGFSDSDGRGSYRTDGIDGIEEIDGEDMTENIEIIREAGKWSTLA